MSQKISVDKATNVMRIAILLLDTFNDTDYAKELTPEEDKIVDQLEELIEKADLLWEPHYAQSLRTLSVDRRFTKKYALRYMTRANPNELYWDQSFYDTKEERDAARAKLPKEHNE